MSQYKKAIDNKGLKKGLEIKMPDEDDIVIKEIHTGIGGDKLTESLPNYINTPCETALTGENGSEIILGRDRPSDMFSGYGGKGDTKCASIDLVVGRMGSEGVAVDEDDELVLVDPDFEKDAARIHISQKTDVDENFGLAGSNEKTKSAIGIKADNVRIISREKIKLVAGVDEKNSQGGNSKANYGIELISNNDAEDLQPLVKGDNLIELLQELIEHIDALNGIVEFMFRQQAQINTVLAGHVHATPGAPSAELLAATIPAALQQAMEGYRSLINHKLNSSMIKLNFTAPIGSKFINSKNNKTN